MSTPERPLERLLSVGEVRELLGLSKATTWRYVKDGVIPSLKIGGRRLVEPAAVRRLIAESRTR